MSKSEKTFDASDWLHRESLELKRIINLARGAPIRDWPPDPFWAGIFQDLKDAIDRGELPAAKRAPPRFNSVRLIHLRTFVVDRDDRWQPLRDFCKRWATVQGVPLETMPAAATVAGKGRRGRKKGSGVYDDSTALKRITELMESGDAKSIHQAAGMVADTCEGASHASMVRRLEQKYSKLKTQGQ